MKFQGFLFMELFAIVASFFLLFFSFLNLKSSVFVCECVEIKKTVYVAYKSIYLENRFFLVLFYFKTALL